jgi:hypothetical protein
VPHDGRPRPARCGFGGELLHCAHSRFRQRPPRIDSRTDSVAVMNQDERQGCPAYACSPARMRIFSRFSGNGSGQVV